ncbi:hypothetical protein SAMN04488065_1885 [Haloplanus vescus]|uniref:Uncharacterized protein n=1 Tax=Haloplanus vescus TaxID=555874 RepID=A0A1H3YHA5_9EURY|nr:hypothetical protein [Haloplanus vescus]SEA10933.1 hypothetical protein SAMN04488065_1885 [Haloplanus vescus]
MSTDPSGRVTDGEQTWLDLVDEVLDTAIDRDEELECTFEEVTVDVPLRMDTGDEFARWHLDGTVSVHVEGTRGPLADWLRWWSRQLS